VKGVYTLEDIDRAALRGTFSSNRLKKFVKQDRYFRASNKEVIDVIDKERQLVIKREARQLEEEEA
jgi:sorbitol-specific phosphotransferase system component IIBC